MIRRFSIALCMLSPVPCGGVMLALLFTSIATSIEAAAPEVRGTWLTTTNEDHIRTGVNTPAVMSDLRNIGLNTVYVETWKNGYTNYPSATLSTLTGGPDRSTFLGSSRDLVDETLIHAHRNGLNYVGWFEYGFSAQFVGNGGTPSNPLANYMRDRGWLLRDQTGKYGNASNGFAWMNPAVPEVREFLINIVLEAVNRYDLDGVQFDDRLAWPKEFGWDATTAAIYLEETGNALPTSVSNSQFRQWRQAKVTQFAQQLSAAVRAARPDILLSVSPSITGFSDTEYNAKWTDWQDQGLFDEFVPQAYRNNLTSFNSIIDAQVAPFEPNDLGELTVGMSVNTSGANTPFNDVAGMITRSRTEGAAGHSLWYSHGVRDDYPAHLTAFYNVSVEGPAANPHFGSDRRLPPLVASLVSAATSTWNVAVEAPAHYRVVAKVGSYWREVDQVTFDIGDFTVIVPGATQVELLVDRRPLDTPDFNGDGSVDAADYTLWRDTLGSSLDLRADANADGAVDLADFDLWRNGFGVPSASGVLSVPEPATLLLLLMLGGAMSISRRSARSVSVVPSLADEVRVES